MTGKAIGTELGQGFVGQVSRQTPIPEIYTRPAEEELAFGTPVKVTTGGQYTAFKNTDTIDLFAGICCRSVLQATSYLQQSEVAYAANQPAAALKKGFIVIQLADTSTPQPEGKVYMSASGFTATSAGNLEIPCLRFSTGKVDANKRVEVEIGYLPMHVDQTAAAS